jgi:hypothetical protein
MQITVNGVVSTIIDIFALYIASLLLKCSDIKKWVIWVYIVLRILDLFSSIYNMFFPLKQTTSSGKSTKMEDPASWTLVGVVLGLMIVLSFVLLAMDIYVLFKMYSCDTVPRNIFWTFVVVCIVGVIVRVLFQNK